MYIPSPLRVSDWYIGFKLRGRQEKDVWSQRILHVCCPKHVMAHRLYSFRYIFVCHVIVPCTPWLVHTACSTTVAPCNVKLWRPVTHGLDAVYSIITFLKIKATCICSCQLSATVYFIRPYAHRSTILEHFGPHLNLGHVSTSKSLFVIPSAPQWHIAHENASNSLALSKRFVITMEADHL